MKLNPVLREGIQIYLVEGESFVVYLHYLLFLAAVECVALYLPALDAQAWRGAAYLFKVSSAACLVLAVYFTLRLANHEFALGRLTALRHWLTREKLTLPQLAAGQLSLLCLQAAILTLLALPLLLWAGAIARTAAEMVLWSIFLVLLYSLAYGVWGLLGAAWFEHRVESRQVFIRCWTISLVGVTSLVYLPLNPVAFLLARLEGKEFAPVTVWGWQGSVPAFHLLFHVLLFALGLAGYLWALRREA